MHVRVTNFLIPLGIHRASPLVEDRKLRRAALLLAIAAAHLAVILWLITRAPAKEPRLAEVTALTLIAPGKDPPAPRPEPRPAKPQPVRLPSPLSDKLRPLVVPADAAAQPSLAASSSGGCDLATAAATAIVQDPAAMAELAALPAGVRTEADAVMLWNGDWLQLTAPNAANVAVPLDSALRRTIEGVVTAAAPECLAADVLGPLFISVPEGPRTTMLVVGSGGWHWADLLKPPPVCAANAVGPCPAAAPPTAPILP